MQTKRQLKKDLQLRKELDIEKQKAETQYQTTLQLERRRWELRLNSFEREYLQDTDNKDAKALEVVCYKLDAMKRDITIEKEEVEAQLLNELIKRKQEADLRFQEKLHAENMELQERLRVLETITTKEDHCHGMCLRSHINKGTCDPPRVKLSY